MTGWELFGFGRGENQCVGRKQRPPELHRCGTAIWCSRSREEIGGGGDDLAVVLESDLTMRTSREVWRCA